MATYHTPVSIPEMVREGKFLHILAPMVRYSKYEAHFADSSFPVFISQFRNHFLTFYSTPRLPFRLLCKKYGCDVLYTPMITSEDFVASQEARLSEFSTNLGTLSLLGDCYGLFPAPSLLAML